MENKDLFKWIQRPVDNAKLTEIKGQTPIVSRLLAQRNIDNIDSFIDIAYKNLKHPNTLDGVEKAAQLFLEVVKEKGKVGVIGDYDADGILSSVMIKELCKVYNLECTVFLPSRFDHGYGLNAKTIASFKEKIGEPVDLLIVTDCGSNNEAEVLELRKFGIKKVIIIDHHLVDKKTMSKSADVLINWHLTEGHDEMCACGEVFKFIRGIKCFSNEVNPVEFLSYAAVGTVADVMPIIGDNRIIVRNGLSAGALNYVTASGLNALLRSSKVQGDGLTQEEVAFRIAPRINAVGRLDDPYIAYSLMIEENMDDAERIAEYMEIYNKDRKQLQKDIELEAESKALSANYKHGILVYDDKWNVGVVGIVASRLVDKFRKPVVIVGAHDGVVKGSGRSVEDVNLKAILDKCQHLFNSYGGHEAAAGVTLKKEMIKTAGKEFDQACKKYYQEQSKTNVITSYYDGALKLGAVNENIASHILDIMYPYCKYHNPEPIFLLKGVDLAKVSVKEGEGWRLLSVNVMKDGKMLEYPFKMFSHRHGSEISGLKADVYFKFPQKWSQTGWSTFQLQIEHLELKS